MGNINGRFHHHRQAFRHGAHHTGIFMAATMVVSAVAVMAVTNASKSFGRALSGFSVSTFSGTRTTPSVSGVLGAQSSAQKDGYDIRITGLKQFIHEGETIFRLDVSVRNATQSKLTLSPAQQFKLADTAGKSYAFTSDVAGSKLRVGEIPANETVTGSIDFMFTDDTRAGALLFRPSENSPYRAVRITL